MKQILFFSLILFSASSFAQGVRGFVLSHDKKPLTNATVYNLQTGAHEHSNENGFFLLRGAHKGDSLRITHVSCSPLTILADQDTLRIILQPSAFQLENVTITAAVRHLNIISDADLQTNPVNSSQELLRKVPGLFIGQHAGGGKAEQIFLRGFDIDHGTDINISVDGMPVNMVSHAHGQGYADLHFLIPETIGKIDFDKGPYYANKGNLATAGYVAFETKDRLDHSLVQLEAGKFNSFRTLGMFNIVNNEKNAAWFAADYIKTDGFFDSPQNFNRLNLMGKYSAWLPGNDKLSIAFSHFNSEWNASGQIPERAVKDGSIGRFGAIDDTEGGNTSRTNINLQFLKQVDENTFVKNTAYFSHYDFELYSNFTFFLNDPVNGDQIRQKEKRNIIGFQSELNRNFYWKKTVIDFQAAVGLRNDAIDNIELSHTVNRKTTIEPVMLGDINETNLFGYANAEIRAGKWVINPGIRIDHLKFDYTDHLSGTYKQQSQSKAAFSPKLNFIFNQDHRLQYFLKLGKGFHSNDTRVVVAQEGHKILPAAYGADLGILWKPLPRLMLNAAAWYLYLEQEFVYVGDEGVVEPSGKTRRQGFDFGARYQLGKYLFLNGDLTYTYARATEEPKGEDRIPLAPRITTAGGISFKHPSGFSASLKTRYLDDRPANEDNSIIAKGYWITDASLNFQWGHFGFGIITENIFNKEWNETQFATTSRLKNEPGPVTEIHFTPGTPFNLRAMISYRF
ncbi:TonB-dependent receptor [Pseudobacter ginsenosidimutans]|uniref:Outer membrane receptor protein involved in Fe transport n=1 Tax=Pseudobacter ginsenosidimutans TaxID=661488 RepID=A0A4V2F200_9BACT|nr:TonB-dependent receptor [Pseudobacter ginsenosidimutans]QEC44105.1 TonB-dependent receptor [Pseudobacter ginsenosidimutans]RZS75546.1 outer membrane receptor protein involved in Fe transport [Pseudobacter ginsenosidimutans]